MSSRVTIPARFVAVHDRQAPNPVLHHQCRGLLEIHVRLAGHQRAGRMLVDGLGAGVVLGQRADRQVAIGDHRRRLALGVAEHHRADMVAPHQLGDLEHIRVQPRR